MALAHRTKILAAIIQELEEIISESEIHSLVYLYTHEFIDNNIYYNFVLKDNLPYSFQLEADKAVLIKKKILKNEIDWTILKNNIRFASELDFFEQIAIQQLKNFWKANSFKELKEALYNKHSDFFKPNLKTKQSEEVTFYTIGYEGISLDTYINKLINNNVKLLCDVRKNAYSQKQGFSKAELENSLTKVGIKYQHIPQLGIISEKRQQLKTDKDYQLLFDEYEKTTLIHQEKEIELLIQLLKKNKHIAITCFEAKVCYCHRGRVAEAVKKNPRFKYKIEHL